MDINKNQLTNTFLKGMNTDTSDFLLGSDQYRYAENVRLSTNSESNGGELRLVDGTEDIKIIEDTTNNDAQWQRIIAMTAIRQYLIVAGSRTVIDEEEIDGNQIRTERKVFNIYKYDVTAPENGFTPIIQGEGLPFESDTISLVTRWETDKAVKLYIADGAHQVMVINLETINQTVKSIEDLTNNQRLFLTPIEANVSSSPGFLKPAKVAYAYQFYNENAQKSRISPLSKEISLYQSSNKGYDRNPGTETLNAIDLQLQNDHGQFQFVKIYRITYRINGQAPEIYCIWDDAPKEGGLYLDDGTNVGEPLSPEEVFGTGTVGVVPKSIESKGNYLFAANVSYSEDEMREDFALLKGDLIIRRNGLSEKENDTGFSYQFDAQEWADPETGLFGGKGKYFNWNFIHEDINVHYDNSIDLVNGVEPSNKSLMRGEVYRYGVILYDNIGRKLPVQWLADIMVPPASYSDDANGDFNPVVSRGDDYYTMRKLGIRFTRTSKSFPIIEKNNEQVTISAWEIVRCLRKFNDKISLMLGIVGLPLRPYMVQDNLIGIGLFGGGTGLYFGFPGNTLFEKFLYAYLYAMQKHDSGVSIATEQSQSSSNDKVLLIILEECRDGDYLYPSGFMSLSQYVSTWGGMETAGYFSNTGIVQRSVDSHVLFASPDYCYFKDEAKSYIDNNKTPNTFLLKLLQSYNVAENHNGGLTTWGEGYEPEKQFVGFTNFHNLGMVLNHTWYDYSAFSQNGNGIRVTDEARVPSTFIYMKALDSFPTISDSIEEDIEPFFINGMYCTDSPEYRLFSAEGLLRYKQDKIGVGDNLSFINWVAAPYHTEDGAEEKAISDAFTEGSEWARAPIATGGRCIVLHMNNDVDNTLHKLRQSNSGDGGFLKTMSCWLPITTANIMRRVPRPYGGYNVQQFNKSEFYSSGAFDTNVDPGHYMDVYDGDTYLGIFTYNSAHMFWDEKFNAVPRMSVVYSVPIESAVNLRACFGDLYTNMNLSSQEALYIQDKEADIHLYGESSYTQERAAYEYNSAYSAFYGVIPYSPVKSNGVETPEYDCRIHYSKPKENGELTDSWLDWRATDFIDVDSRFGPVTNIRLFKDKLLFWQESSTGLLSVNDRYIVPQITQDSEGIIDSSRLVLGDGEVTKRYDYISTVYGMKDGQRCDTQSNAAIYWWDEYNKELLQYSQHLIPLTKHYSLENYINQRVNVETPCLAFDRDYDEMFANVRRPLHKDEETLVFGERYNMFTSVYTFAPKYSSTVDGRLYLSDGVNIYRTKNELPEYSNLFGVDAHPLVQYIVNNSSTYNKTFDIQTIGGRFYGGDDLSNLNFVYTTPLKLESRLNGGETEYTGVSNREYDFRLNIPRAGKEENGTFVTAQYGDRMRGKTMQCELSSTSNSTDFSLQCVTTKYRMSWS